MISYIILNIYIYIIEVSEFVLLKKTILFTHLKHHLKDPQQHLTLPLSYDPSFLLFPLLFNMEMWYCFSISFLHETKAQTMTKCFLFTVTTAITKYVFSSIPYDTYLRNSYFGTKHTLFQDQYRLTFPCKTIMSINI